MRAASDLRYPENVTRPFVLRGYELMILSGPPRELIGVDVVEERANSFFAIQGCYLSVENLTDQPVHRGNLPVGDRSAPDVLSGRGRGRALPMLPRAHR